MTAPLFTLSREALLPALGAVNKAVAKRNTIPVLSNVMISYDDGALVVTGTDLDVEVHARVKTDSLKPFEGFTLPSALLHDAVRKMPEAADIAFVGEAKDSMMSVSAGKIKFRMQILPAADFPTMNAGELPHTFAVPAKQIGRILATCSFAISSEETRYYLNGIFVHADENSLTAVATDGHRLAMLKSALPEGADGMPGVIIPRKTVSVLAPYTVDDGDVEVSLSESKIRFTMPDGVTIISKLIDGTFPDYKRVIPSANPNHFEIKREELGKALDRVMTLATDKGRACKFEFGDSALQLTASNPDQGSAEDQVDLAQIKGEPVTIGFNGRYCLDMLSAAGTEAVCFELDTPGSPSRIIPVDPADKESTVVFVLMPMRV